MFWKHWFHKKMQLYTHTDTRFCLYALGHDYKMEFWLGLQLKKKKFLKTTVVKNEYISLNILISVFLKISEIRI